MNTANLTMLMLHQAHDEFMAMADKTGDEFWRKTAASIGATIKAIPGWVQRHPTVFYAGAVGVPTTLIGLKAIDALKGLGVQNIGKYWWNRQLTSSELSPEGVLRRHPYLDMVMRGSEAGRNQMIADVLEQHMQQQATSRARY